jgi:5-hydroxyisourate hydrolase-like protein (transthyretin family)
MNKLLAFIFLISFSISNWQCNTLKKLGLVPNELEMATGLKGALEQGLFKGFDAFANPNSNAALLLKLPGEIDKIKSTLETLGVKVPIADITQKLTAAMGTAMTTAKPIFMQSLKDMSIKDAAKILVTNNEHAATDYFKANATANLTKAFVPIVDSTIKINGADKEYKQIATIFNAIPFTNKKMEDNLSGFIAGRAIDAMFIMIAQEESSIRTKYQLRKTDIIKKVFNYAEQEIKRKLNANPNVNF